MRHILRLLALMIGASLLIGVIPDSAGNLSARGTHLTSVVAIENSSSARQYPPLNPSNILQPVQVDPPKANDSSRLADATDRASPAPDAARPTSGAPMQPFDSIEPELRQRHPTWVQVPVPPAPTASPDEFDLYIHTPPNPVRREAMPVIIALHGMGAQGEVFAKRLLPEADHNGWLLVAPTISYHDYMNPTMLAEDDVRLSKLLAATLDGLPRRLGLKLQPRVLIYGFSRGAQLGHRFALFFPEHVEAVAVLSAGSYTLPVEQGMTESGPKRLTLPYGMADAEKRLNRPMNLAQFKKIPFFIAVGGNDTRASDVPRQFDAFVGKTRVERAQAFDRELASLGMKCKLLVAPNAGHEVNSEMFDGAMKFLRENELDAPARRSPQ